MAVGSGSKLKNRPYQNPVYPHYFADPFVFRHESLFYAVGTSPECGNGDPNVFPMLASEDLVEWERLNNALVPPDGMADGTFWAPEIAEHDGRFYMYYSVGQDDKDHHLRVAVSEKPGGPYRDQARLSDPALSFAIDGHPYRHTDGEWYLFYAVDLLDGERSGTSIVADRLIDMTRLAGETIVVARATRDWQRYESNRAIYGGRYDWHTLEGPFVVTRQGKIYCLYSGGNWQNETYGVDYVVADHPLGPYCNTAGEAPRLLKTKPNLVLGPGHNSVVRTMDDQAEMVVYHAWDPAMTARTMRIDPLVWTDEGPRCHGPSITPQPAFG
ncbi:MAG: glycoside hydrolase family 43 protein [Fimbriimonadaceae bacterium]